MPLRGVNQAKKRTQQIMTEVIVKKAQRTVTQMQIAIIARAQMYMPREFSFLINSTFRMTPELKDGKMAGNIGNTVGYAVYLHSPKKGGKLDGWQPMPPEDKFGPSWNPDAQQNWFGIAVSEEKKTLDRIIARGMKL